jgi:hypothetical protein
MGHLRGYFELSIVLCNFDLGWKQSQHHIWAILGEYCNLQIFVKKI